MKDEKLSHRLAKVASGLIASCAMLTFTVIGIVLVIPIFMLAVALFAASFALRLTGN